MKQSPTLAFLLMDAPYEQARTATAFRLLDAALRAGYGVRVFAYEGAVSLPVAQQKPHANSMHGHDAEEEDHPNPRVWIRALMELAAALNVPFDWVNCGLCVDERGANDTIEGVRRGSPIDFWAMVGQSDNTLIIPTR